AILVPVGFEEITRYIPTSNGLPPNLIPSLQWVAIGLLIVIFLWFRPQGVLPERRRVIRVAALGPPVSAESPVVRGTEEASPHAASPAEASAPGAAPPAEPRAVSAAPRPAALAPAAAAAAAAARSPGAGDVVLQATDVVREFGGLRAVTGVSLSVRRGTLTGLIGPNGAGKSTLLAMLAGTLPVSAGEIRYLGEDVTSLPAFQRARLGLIRTFQLASEFKRLTVMENLLTSVPHNRGDSFRGALAGPRYWRGDEDAAIARATTLLEQFGLEGHANSYAGDLSGGQRRMVEIMRALMAEPKVLLLDEPMAGVHPNLARRIGGQLVALTAGGLTVLMVEHELAIMDEFCDPVVAMAEGAVLAQGTMSELRQRSDVVEAYLVG
ncbi:MAG TPA: ABC transporter ATP-binding protein, partial [Trebonia sp.]|nr:ABC transporter ATP-binding protein [Trebonia sp.]